MEQFVTAKPSVLALIWGPIKLILQVSQTHIQSFDKILDAMQKIGNCLPRFEQFGDVFAHNPRVGQVLVWLYSDLLEFYTEVLRFFSKKGQYSACHHDATPQYHLSIPCGLAAIEHQKIL